MFPGVSVNVLSLLKMKCNITMPLQVLLRKINKILEARIGIKKCSWIMLFYYKQYPWKTEIIVAVAGTYLCSLLEIQWSYDIFESSLEKSFQAEVNSAPFPIHAWITSCNGIVLYISWQIWLLFTPFYESLTTWLDICQCQNDMPIQKNLNFQQVSHVVLAKN